MPLDGHVHPEWTPLAQQFARMYGKPSQGGGALAVHLRGETVVDVWGGYADPTTRRPWTRDTAAMSFSTTKGVMATLVHRLADQGRVHLDRPVAEYWAQFGANGKHRMTVAQMLAHAGGLHGLRDLVDHADDVLDHRQMSERLAAARPSPTPGRASGYHGLTFGWLAGGLVEAVTGDDVREVLRRELAEPLGIEAGLWFGAPPDERHQVARLFPDMLRATGAIEALIEGINARWPRSRHAEAFLVPGIGTVLFDEGRIHDTAFPSVNGIFTARALATVYATLAHGGRHGTTPFLRHETVHAAGRVRMRDRDYILQVPMRWRSGYHRAFVLGRAPRRAFGHFGFGGSGAWADPDTGMAIAFVTNRLGSASTPMGDLRLPRLGRTAHALALRSSAVRR